MYVTHRSGRKTEAGIPVRELLFSRSMRAALLDSVFRGRELKRLFVLRESEVIGCRESKGTVLQNPLDDSLRQKELACASVRQPSV